MRRSDVNEVLAQLYLRLNGYFTTGLILHSPEWGQAQTEIDCLAIRHPNHRQPEREVKCAEFLDLQRGEIDLILCEVKSDPSSVAFNQALREDAQVIQTMLQWAGVLPDDQLASVASQLQPLLSQETPLHEIRAGVVNGHVRIRPLLCCPTIATEPNNRWCLTGKEILRFANQCFNPPQRRAGCSTRYNFQQWGFPFEPVVRYMKDVASGSEVEIEDLYRHLEAA